jgi:hypothetical protein
VSRSYVTISSPHLLSISETRVDPGIGSWRKQASEWARCQKAIGGIYFPKKWKAETPHLGFEFDIFKPRLESSIFKCISWLNGSFWGWWSRLFWKRESIRRHHDNIMAQLSPLN